MFTEAEDISNNTDDTDKTDGPTKILKAHSFLDLKNNVTNERKFSTGMRLYSPVIRSLLNHLLQKKVKR